MSSVISWQNYTCFVQGEMDLDESLSSWVNRSQTIRRERSWGETRDPASLTPHPITTTTTKHLGFVALNGMGESEAFSLRKPHNLVYSYDYSI